VVVLPDPKKPARRMVGMGCLSLVAWRVSVERRDVRWRRGGEKAARRRNMVKVDRRMGVIVIISSIGEWVLPFGLIWCQCYYCML
jgi:hypothetical protein